jgi:hypothetical protein
MRFAILAFVSIMGVAFGADSDVEMSRIRDMILQVKQNSPGVQFVQVSFITVDGNGSASRRGVSSTMVVDVRGFAATNNVEVVDKIIQPVRVQPVKVQPIIQPVAKPVYNIQQVPVPAPVEPQSKWKRVKSKLKFWQ